LGQHLLEEGRDIVQTLSLQTIVVNHSNKLEQKLSFNSPSKIDHHFILHLSLLALDFNNAFAAKHQPLHDVVDGGQRI